MSIFSTLHAPAPHDAGTDGRDGVLGVPPRPIVIRQDTFGPARPDAATAHRHGSRTWRRIMYLVGFATQAVVLGAVVAAVLTYETPIRETLGLVTPEAGRIETAIGDIDRRLTTLAGTVDALTATLGTVADRQAELGEEVTRLAAEASGPADAAAIDARLAALERQINAIAAKMDEADAIRFTARGSRVRNVTEN